MHGTNGTNPLDRRAEAIRKQLYPQACGIGAVIGSAGSALLKCQPNDRVVVVDSLIQRWVLRVHSDRRLLWDVASVSVN